MRILRSVSSALTHSVVCPIFLAMTRQMLSLVAIVLVASATGCQSALSGWAAGLQRQYQHAVEGMKEDLSVLDSDHDGLDAFGPEAAKEMRALRADMTE